MLTPTNVILPRRENTRSARAEDNEAIIPYLETKAGAFTDSFHYVDIHEHIEYSIPEEQFMKEFLMEGSEI